MAELRLPYINLVMIAGRLVDDPHPLTGKDGTPGCAVTVTVNRWKKGKTLAAALVDCIAWGETAAAMVGSLRKGSPVLITGALSQYTKRGSAGELVARLQVTVQVCQFLEAKQRDITLGCTSDERT